jgi:hypothetical protein
VHNPRRAQEIAALEEVYEQSEAVPRRPNRRYSNGMMASPVLATVR